MKIEIEVGADYIAGLEHVCGKANAERREQEIPTIKSDELAKARAAAGPEIERLSSERAKLFSVEKPDEAEVKKLNDAIIALRDKIESDADLAAEKRISALDETPESYLLRVVSAALQSYAKQEREARVRAAVEASM